MSDTSLSSVARAGFCRLPSRTQVVLTGGDRARFLHGLCTNDIQSLVPGSGCEVFLTNVQGKTAGYAYVFCTPESLIIDSEPDQSAAIIDGMDRYLIREDVEIQDDTGQSTQILITGEQARQRLQDRLRWTTKSGPLFHTEVTVGGSAFSLRSVPFAGPGSYFLCGPKEQLAGCCARLGEAEFAEFDLATANVMRIEAGTPQYGIDLSADNLPQELGRNKEAIHFDKGCYLGQETIARLDALGHVNRLLVGLRFTGEQVPAAGSVLKAGGKPLARITSSCWSPKLDAPLALAYVRRSHMEVGASFDTEYGEAEVIVPPRRVAQS